MIPILINIIQHEQYYLIILIIGLKAATLLKKRCFPVNFAKLLWTTFFIEHNQVTAFGLSFVNSRDNCLGTILVKLLRPCHFHIKRRKDLLTRSNHWRCSIKKGFFKSFTKFKHLQQSFFFNKVAGHRRRLFAVNFVKF